jgi:hypothetical protein
LAVNNDTFAVLRKRREATFHLQAIGHPVKEFRACVVDLTSKFTHGKQTFLKAIVVTRISE